jgi:hypothetical protein
MSYVWEPKPEPRVLAFNAYPLLCVLLGLGIYCGIAAGIWILMGGLK